MIALSPATNELLVRSTEQDVKDCSQVLDKSAVIESLERAILFLKNDCDRQALSLVADAAMRLGWFQL